MASAATDLGGERMPMSVVVPTFERPQQLSTLLEALTRQRLPREQFEVLVVDDTGTGGIAPIVQAFAGRLDLRLLVEPHRGCAGARHAGCARAVGRHLVFTDDDCVPDPEWLPELHRTCLAHPGAAIGGAVLNGLPDNPYSEASHLVVDALMERTAFFTTNNAAFPAERFRQVGGMDDAWGIAGGEDRDLCWRWVRQGFPVVKAGSAIVRHQHALTLATFWRQHFHYGRGACKLRRRAAKGKVGVIPFESSDFYARLVLRPLGRHRLPRALRLSLLILLSQAATAAGFARQRVALARGRASMEGAALTSHPRP